MPAAQRKKASKGPQEAARSAFRDELRVAAENVFSEKGFGATKMTDIAAEAGVGVGTLYNYFANKQEIFEAIFLSRSVEFEAALDQATAGLSPIDAVCAIIRSTLAYLEQHAALFVMFFERGGIGELDIGRLGGNAIDETYTRFLRRLELAMRAAVEDGTLRDDIPVATMVAALSGARNGAIYAWLKNRRRGRLAEMAENLLTLFLSGARAKS